jgi:hypothetical protein
MATTPHLQMSRQLIFLWQRHIEQRLANPRTKATAVSRGHFDGACSLAHSLGYGLTQAHVAGTVRNAIPSNDPREWMQQSVIDDLAERLQDLQAFTRQHTH